MPRNTTPKKQHPSSKPISAFSLKPGAAVARISILAFTLAGIVSTIGPIAAQETTADSKKTEDSSLIDANGKRAAGPINIADAKKTPDQLKKETAGRIKIIDENNVKIGLITLLKKERRISIPVQFAERERQLEYLMVHENGKAHESLFTTKASPYNFHIAALLLKAGTSTASIEVEIPRNGGARTFPISKFLTAPSGQEGIFAPKAWKYNGSSSSKTAFLAAQEGSFISLIKDSSALMENPKTSMLKREQIILTNKDSIPRTQLQVILHVSFD